MQELSALVKAMKPEKNANLKLLPIFFMISPKEVSHITKDSPEWQKLEVNNDTRREWQDAVKVVRSINGLTFGEDGDEVDLRDKIVKEICCFLRRIKPPMLLEFKPVGIENQVREVKALLDMKGTESALAVIVYGFGGVGKSTLAASVVESLDWSSTDFKFCRVAIDEKTTDKTSHIINLQKHILYVLGGAEVCLGDILEGRHKIKQALENKCCLLFIDNVVDKVYIQDILPHNLFPAEQKTKLRIIITSRENNLKAELKILWQEYEVKGLSDAASKHLLVEKIVPSQVVENIYLFEEEKLMMNEVATECRGVPLLLSVFGKHLSVERNKDSYQEVLDVLKEGNLDNYLDEDLDTRLMFVYNKIKDVEVKEAFLDICIYFHSWKWNSIMDIVDSRQLKDLHRRGLVSKSSSGEVIVHDILRFMGMKEAKLTRFSNYKELSYALENNLIGFENVKGISLLNDNSLITIKSTQLEAMHQSLRVLMLGDWVSLDGPPCRTAFRNLRCLYVGDVADFPLEDPSKLDKLRVFLNKSKPGMNLCHLPSSLKRICHEGPHVERYKFVELPFQNLESLKSFTVKTQKSVELSEELHFPASLVELSINGCKNLPKDISYLTALESLILDRSDLEYLPQGFGKLRKLKFLSIDYCSKLAFLSEELGMLPSLEVLRMEGCEKLRAFPESLGELLSLQTLEFSECINLQELPESFGELRIQSLNLHKLVNIHELPNSFGNMPLLRYLSLESCYSLMSLPESFVQLKMLETLKIIKCTKLRLLPQDFGQLICLKHMTVETCHLLEELPREFGALPALKTFRLRCCESFLNLSKGFTELTSLEELSLALLPFISRLPDGFGNLKKLRLLNVVSCCQLTFPDDFENMATLERLSIRWCWELDGAMMEKILKLPNCYMVDIYGSDNMLEKWKHMQGKTEHPIVVLSGEHEVMQEKRRAIRVALLHGKCMEVNNDTGQLMERSSLLVGLEEGTTAAVALIMLPINMQSHQQRTLQRFVEKARKTAQANGWGKLQIVCARKVELYAERPRATEEEERAEEEGIRRILLSLPKGSCAIPSSESKRVKILTYCHIGYKCNDKLSFFMANFVVDIEGHKFLENSKFTEDEISGDVVMKPLFPAFQMGKAKNNHHNSIQNFIKSISVYGQSQSGSESKTGEFMEAVKGSGIHYLLTDNNTSKVMIDDLHGKAIGFIICNFKAFECLKLQQIYKDLQEKDSNFIWIWIPTFWPENCGHGTYTKLVECMPWAAFPYPHLVIVSIDRPYLVLLEKDGHIANRDALPLLMGWGLKSYPFTQHTIPQSFFSEESESYLEFLLHGMNIVGRKAMRSKMTLLYAAHPLEILSINSELKKLTQIQASFEVLYVGNFYEMEICSNIENLKQGYEDARQNMRWPSLSFSDMIMFWYRCKYFAKLEDRSNKMMNNVHLLAFKLYFVHRGSQLVLVDNHGAVRSHGENLCKKIRNQEIKFMI